MKKSIRSNAKRIAVASLVLAVTSGVIVIVHAGGLAPRPVGEIHSKLEIIDDGGVQECMVTGKQTYSQATKEGMAQVTIKRDGVRVASASARLRADTDVQAAAAVSALVLYLTGRQARPGYQCQDIDEGAGRGFQCFDIKTDGNVRVLLEHCDEIVDWWDAQASLTHTGYVSPRVNLANLGKLQLNVWNGSHQSFVILLFDPGDPTSITGGRLVGPAPNPNYFLDVSSGSLTENTATTIPGDFLLHFEAVGFEFEANLAIDTQTDGTIDVRGRTISWPPMEGLFIVEGTGNTKFIVPGQ